MIDNKAFVDFYENKNSEIKKYLKQKLIINDNDEIKLKNDNDEIKLKFDLDLFVYNIKNFPFAKSNISVCLSSLVSNNIILYQIRNIVKYYCNPDKNILEYPNENLVYEFIGIITFYYFTCLQNGIDIAQKQNQLLQENTDTPQYILSKYGYEQYYFYYNQKLNYAKNHGKIFPTELINITHNDIKKAINKINKIDLSNVIKKLIIGINIGTILFKAERKPISNSVQNINPILLLNRNNQCYFNSTLQLINAAVEYASSEVLSKISNKSNNGYVLVEFLNYLKNKNTKLFNKGLKLNNNGLNLHNEFKEFETEILNAWNDIPEVKEGKEIMDVINNEQIIAETGPTAMAILAKIFPEIKELFFVNWDNISQDNFKNKNFTMFNFNTTNCDCGYCDKIPDNFAPYFMSTNLFTWNTIHKQIEQNELRIGFDKNNNFAVYTVKGLQLITSAITKNASNNNYITYAVFDNNSNTWYFSNNVEYNSPPNEELNVFEQINIETGEDDYITAFMYRKMTNTEIMQYIS
ncbi:MAG: hypothetical protein IJ848_00965 [Alphaproteobacteria bacterium]|nr:hypothetical protein [Alphaproteobacteria bacterium]